MLVKNELNVAQGWNFDRHYVNDIYIDNVDSTYRVAIYKKITKLFKLPTYFQKTLKGFLAKY